MLTHDYNKGAILGSYWGYMGIMEEKIETSIEGLGFRIVDP